MEALVGDVVLAIDQERWQAMARFFVGVAFAQFLFALLPAVVWLFLVPPTLAISLARSVPSGHTLWGDSVLHRYQSASTHADPLQRIALLGPAAMPGGRLDDLRSLIENVEADRAAAGCGCGC
jgi:hypothetical protein